MWVRDWHDASTYGTNLLDKFLPKRNFPFPKSLYAVEDTLRFYLANRPNALVIDFLLEAAQRFMRLIYLMLKTGDASLHLVTNNEVADSETKSLKSKGLQPGDEEWEKLGIARYVTWPRTVCSIKGHDINGKPLQGEYLGTDRPMSDGFAANAEYFKLGFWIRAALLSVSSFVRFCPCFG